MSITANEIARIVGVSPATVSIVLNNRPGVSEETRKQILDVARSLGYSKTGKNKELLGKSLGLVIYKKHGDVVGDTPSIAEFVQGIEQESRAQNYNLLLFYFYENADPAKQLAAIMSSSCSGLILLATEMYTSDLSNFDNIALPIVLLDNARVRLDKDCIIINNKLGVAQALNYLEQQGHRKIGYLHSSTNIANFEERCEAFTREMTVKKLYNQAYILNLDPTAEGAYRDVKAWLETRPEMPTAFFADDDIIAMSAIRALRETGYKTPADVSIIGFDDIATAAMTEPPLSTVRVARRDMGMNAVDQLLKRVDGLGGKASVCIEVNTSLVERFSAAQLAALPPTDRSPHQ
jgi:LacI family transcriptional regulator